MNADGVYTIGSHWMLQLAVFEVELTTRIAQNTRDRHDGYNDALMTTSGAYTLLISNLILWISLMGVASVWGSVDENSMGDLVVTPKIAMSSFRVDAFV
jgi:hypothetical protein